MANEPDLKLIQIPEFPKTDTLVGSGSEYVVLTKADGVTYGMLTEDFKAFLGTVQVQVPKALAPTDPAPTLSGVYYPTVTQNEAGTPIVYANAGGISVNTAEGGADHNSMVQLIYDGSSWVKVNVPIEVPEPDLTPYALKTEVDEKLNISDVKGVQSKNLFDKNAPMRDDQNITSIGIISGSPGSITTMDLDLDPNETHITISGHTLGLTHRVSFINASGEVTQTSNFNVTDPTTIAIDRTNGKAPVKYRLWFKNPAEDDSVLDRLMVNYGSVALPYESFAGTLTEVAGFTVPFVNSDEIKSEILQEAVSKDSVKTRAIVISNQQYDISKGYLTGKLIATSGAIGNSSSPDSYVTLPIKLNREDTHLAVSGMTAGLTHGVTFTKDLAGSQVVAFVRSVLPDRIEVIPWDQVAETENIYASVWFRNGSEPIENIPQVLSDFMIAFSETYLPKDEYTEVEEVYEIDGQAVLNRSDLNDQYATKKWVEDNFSDGGSGIAEVPKRLDDRYRNDFKVKELINETLRYNNTLQSLRKIKQAGSGEKVFNIPNSTGVEQTDVTLILNLHHGAQVGTGSNFDLFMDGLCNTDFSDIRFLDASGEMLDTYKESHGNYETIIDTSVMETIALLPNGDLIGTNNNEANGLHLSTDSGYTWTQIKPVGNALGGNANNDVFYSVGSNVYKTTKASNYSDAVMVLPDPQIGEPITWRAKSFVMDDVGNIYLGQYQIAYGAVIWKSTNGGNSFTKCYDSVKQHIHSIILDTSTVPNKIYANCDGSVDTVTGANRGTVLSLDRGETWAEIDFGFLTDSGVLYIGDGYTLGGGESAIKTQPSITKTYADGTTKIILDAQQNTFQMEKLGDAIYVGGTVHSSNRYAKIYRSDDEAETFKTIFDTGMLKEGSMAWGYRFGLYGVMPAKDGKEEMLLWSSGVSVLDNLRIFDGGDHYQALYYVKVPVLPVAGLQLTVGYGYLAEDVQGEIFKDDPIISNRVINLPLNEYGRYVYDDKGNEYKINAENNWSSRGKRYGWMVPFKSPIQNASVQFKNDAFVTIENEGNLDFNKNFTVNIWMKLDDVQTFTRKFMFGREGATGADHLFFYSRGSILGIRYGSNSKELDGIFSTDFSREFIMLSVVVTGDTVPDYRIFINGSRHNLDGYNPGTYPLDGFNNSMASGDWFVGGLHGEDSGMISADTSLYTDFSLFNRALTDAEVKQIYEGANLFRP